MDLKKITILNIKINSLTKNEVWFLIKNLLSAPTIKQEQLVTTNPEFIMQAQTDLEFKNIINNSWLSVADGYGIRLAAQYLDLIKNNKKNNLLAGLKVIYWGFTHNYKKLDMVPEIITGTDLIPEICQIININEEIHNKKIFLLGGFGKIPLLTAENLKKQYHNLNISYSSFETDNIIEKINSFEPLVLFVALNHPRAQKWINANLEKMPSVKLAIGVGGAFDYISGQIKRAPQNMRGFEWLYRLVRQPRRFKRVYSAVVKFSCAVFKSKIKT